MNFFALLLWILLLVAIAMQGQKDFLIQLERHIHGQEIDWESKFWMQCYIFIFKKDV